MDDGRFATLYRLVEGFAPRRGKRQLHSDATVALVLLWSALNRRPRAWACDRRNAPAPLAGCDPPSPSTLSRRLRSESFALFWKRLLDHALSMQAKALCLLGLLVIDGRALPVNRYSKDKQARWGWAGGGLARGYKLFLLAGAGGRVVAWSVHAMNRAEQAEALELIRHADTPGYLLADGVHDTNDLHEGAEPLGLRVLCPRKTAGVPMGERALHPGRVQSAAMLETHCASRFGVELYAKRTAIERSFSAMAGSRVGLDSLPPWVRTLARVRLWVDAAIVFYVLFAATK